MGEGLKRGIEGQHQVATGLTLLAPDLANNPAERVDFQMTGSGGASKLQIVLLLRALLADPKPGQLEQRISRLLTLVHGGHVTEHMGHGLGEGIVSGLADLDIDAGQVRCIDLDPADLLPAQIVADRDRNESALVLGLTQDAREFLLGQADHLGQQIECLLDVARLFAHQDYAVVLLVHRHRHAESVDDAPARRRQQPQVDPVVLGEGGIALGLDHLEVIHAPGQHREQRRLRAADDKCPAGEGAVAFVVLVIYRHVIPMILSNDP